MISAALAAAIPGQRRVVLLAHRQEILDDGREVLGEVDETDFSDLREKLAEALAAAGGGHDAAAQALATNIMDTTLRQFFSPVTPAGRFKYHNAVKKIDANSCSSL